MIEGLKDKVVVVTGGGHGIGKAYCLGFAQSGSHVVVADIDKPAAEQVGAEITQQTGARVRWRSTRDVSDESSTTKAMAAQVMRTLWPNRCFDQQRRDFRDCADEPRAASRPSTPPSGTG